VNSGGDQALAGLTRRLEGTGVPSLAMYKDRCLQRRLAVRMRARGVTSLAEYAALIDRDPSELDRLVDALTINVTSVYRNPEAWERLALELEALAADPAPGLAAWSAGCASGEEAWTVAMLLADAFAAAGRPWGPASIRVDATDVDPGAIARAVTASYPVSVFEAAPPALVERWTEPCDAGRRFGARLRELVHFTVRDLGRDGPPGSRYDLITCRNVLIYFERATQERLLDRFADALRPGGLLFLGKVESLVGPARRRLEPVDRRERLFRRVD
jgi:chemotaxis methyl-accepting protein methylase